MDIHLQAIVDERAIQQVLYRIGRAQDNLDEESVVREFTEDVTWTSDIPGVSLPPIQGQAALLAHFHTQHEKQRKLDATSRHVVSNILYEERTPDMQKVRSFVVSVVTRDGKPGVAWTATYDDTFVRTASGWKVQSRAFRADSILPLFREP